ncbi:MAG: hypothetical protein ACRC5T_00460, partial [Cetobacterium sp.]
MLKRIGTALVNPSFIRSVFVEAVNVTGDEIKYSMYIEYSNGDCIVAERGVVFNRYDSVSDGLDWFKGTKRFELEDDFVKREM